jgi:hypothetical protein
MPAVAKKAPCCSARTSQLKLAAYTKAFAKAQAKSEKLKQDAKVKGGPHTHMNPPKKKATAKKHPAVKKAKPCSLCGKYAAKKARIKLGA